MSYFVNSQFKLTGLLASLHNRSSTEIANELTNSEKIEFIEGMVWVEQIVCK